MSVKITACLIVRDEEELLPQCLESIKGLMDSIIVVDTGSSDRTVEVAKSFGAKVYHSLWRDDFSYHRNESISYAKNSDYVLIIDADEVLKAPKGFNKKYLKNWLKQIDKKYEAIAVTIHDIQKGDTVMNCNSARIFKRESIRYENKIHNTPVFNGSALLLNGVVIEHYGYDLSPEKMENKFQRTYNLLMKEVEDKDESGIPKRPDAYFYLAQILGHYGRHEESRKWGMKYLALKDNISNSKFNKTIYYTLAKSFHQVNMMKEAYEIILAALKENPLDPDMCHALSDHGVICKNHLMMADGARRFLAGYKQFMEQPNLKAGQFYFTLREDVVTLMIYRLYVAAIQETMKTWEVFKGRIKETSDQLQLELESNIRVFGHQKHLEELKTIQMGITN